MDIPNYGPGQDQDPFRFISTGFWNPPADAADASNNSERSRWFVALLVVYAAFFFGYYKAGGFDR